MDPADEPTPLPGPTASTRSPGVRRVIGGLRIVSARLRFLGVFAVVSLIIGGWDTIRTYWGRLTTSPSSQAIVSSDTEYFCPMDPGILSDWPSKCPVCNMTLVRRKRGESVPMPDGVVARMQFTPYRLWLGGIRTAAVDYAPIARTLEAPGAVTAVDPDRARVVAEFFGHDLPWLGEGQAAELIPADDNGASPAKARVRSVPKGPVEAGMTARVVVESEGRAGAFRQGDRVKVRVRCPVDRIEPFAGQPDTPPPVAKGEPRRLYACMDHPDVARDAPGRCPRDRGELMPRPLRPDQRVRWRCPIHPEINADRAGSSCDACGGMALVPRVVSYRPPGMVLAVPTAAVIDDGSRALVYVENGPGMFDARAVRLGPRCGESYPVVDGLEPGDRVAAQGAFLIDAETRLTSNIAATYFGASDRAPSREPVAGPPGAAGLDGLAPADRTIATRQKTCPVTGKPLGSMGVPPKLVVRGRTMFLCCDGCIPALEAAPEKFLAKLPSEEGP